MKKINDFFNLSKKLNLEIDSIIKFEKLVKQYKSNVFLIVGPFFENINTWFSSI